MTVCSSLQTPSGSILQSASSLHISAVVTPVGPESEPLPQAQSQHAMLAVLSVPRQILESMKDMVSTQASL
jgi:hypothetical protein